jgi:hypothetical protein
MDGESAVAVGESDEYTVGSMAAGACMGVTTSMRQGSVSGERIRVGG